MVSSVQTPLSARNAGAAGERARFSREEFLKLLSAEISHQNPLEPMSSGDFLGQLAQLQQLETSASLEDTLKNLMRFQELGAAGTLLGKTVRAIADDGQPVTGPVERIRVEDSKVRLIINGRTAALGNIQDIVSTDPATAWSVSAQPQ